MSSTMSSPAPSTLGNGVARPEPPMRRWFDRATSVLELAAAAITFFVMILILANVISRFVLSQPVQGTNEIIGHMALPALALIGFIVAQARNQQIEADILYQQLPRQVRREARFVTGVLSAMIAFGFAWYGWAEAMHANKLGRTAPASDILIAPVYWLVPVSFAILTILFLIDAIRSLMGAFDREEFVNEPVGGEVGGA